MNPKEEALDAGTNVDSKDYMLESETNVGDAMNQGRSAQSRNKHRWAQRMQSAGNVDESSKDDAPNVLEPSKDNALDAGTNAGEPRKHDALEAETNVDEASKEYVARKTN